MLKWICNIIWSMQICKCIFSAKVWPLNIANHSRFFYRQLHDIESLFNTPVVWVWVFWIWRSGKDARTWLLGSHHTMQSPSVKKMMSRPSVFAWAWDSNNPDPYYSSHPHPATRFSRVLNCINFFHSIFLLSIFCRTFYGIKMLPFDLAVCQPA